MKIHELVEILNQHDQDTEIKIQAGTDMQEGDLGEVIEVNVSRYGFIVIETACYDD